MAAMSAQVHQLTQWVGTLQQILAARQHQQPQQQQQCSSQERKSGSRSLEAMGTTTGATTAELYSEPGKAERRRDLAIEAAAVIPDQVKDGRDNGASRVCMLVRTGGKPRSIVKGCWANGLEARRKKRNRFDPETKMNQIGATLRAPRPAKVTDIKVLPPSAGTDGKTKCGSTRKQQEQPC